MMSHCWKKLALLVLLGSLNVWMACPSLAKNSAAPFSVHMKYVQSRFDNHGKAIFVIHTDLWEKSPDKFCVENENYIIVSFERKAWSYDKRKNTYRTERPAFTPPDFFTADYRIARSRAAFNNVVVKETPGNEKANALPVVDIYYDTRDAHPSKVHEHIILIDGKSRLRKEMSVEMAVPGGTYIYHRLEEVCDYTPITDESIFHRHAPNQDSVWEHTSEK